MKKLIIPIITIFIFFDNTYAQVIFRPIGNYNVHNMTVIDSGNIRIWYAFNATDINKQETYDDLQRLEIGSRISKYYSYFLFNNDSLITVWTKEHPKAQGVPNQLGTKGKKETWDEYIFSEYFKDYTKKIFTQYTRMPHGVLKPCQYSETIPVQTWNIFIDHN
ncbi:MAG: hypothetical protein LBP63_09520 [Prevotellaceae bacterium]|jgi:GLPGLI family protein|nr:hypothetical protein [Prevotellaceae bacterium]